MSNHENESIIEKKYEDYKDYLESLEYEIICYEFADHLGCEAEEWFTSPSNVTKENMIDVLLDEYSVALFKDPSIEWDQDYRDFNETIKGMDQHITNINKFTSQINKIDSKRGI